MSLIVRVDLGVTRETRSVRTCTENPTSTGTVLAFANATKDSNPSQALKRAATTVDSDKQNKTQRPAVFSN